MQHILVLNLFFENSEIVLLLLKVIQSESYTSPWLIVQFLGLKKL